MIDKFRQRIGISKPRRESAQEHKPEHKPNKQEPKKNTLPMLESDCTFIVNSIGRSGSQMLIKCLLDHKVNVLFHSRPHNNHFWPQQIPETKKVVFIYADPISIYLSVRNQPLWWAQLHYENLRGDFSQFRNCSVDSLGLERLFDAYMKPQRFSLLSVRYEKLWDNQDALSAFVGVKITLPTYRARKKRIDLVTEEEYFQLQKTYDSLVMKMAGYPSVINWKPVVVEQI